MIRQLTALILAMAALAASASAAEPANASTAAESQNTNQRVFHAEGVVVEVQPRQKSITIQHHEIPGFMPAMTMPFEVRDTNELAGIEAGDPVSFRVIIAGTEGWIDQIRRTGPKTNVPPATERLSAARDVKPLKPGDLLPEYHFTNQLGQPFSTAKFKGQALAINFLYTRCPFPTFCPLTARNFEETQQRLLALPRGPTNWQLLTISFDPDFDTPAVLKTYAENHNYDPAHWTFATGAPVDLAAITEPFGELFWRNDSGGLSHNLRTVVIAASGRVQEIIPGNQWTPEELVQEMVKAAETK